MQIISIFFKKLLKRGDFSARNSLKLAYFFIEKKGSSFIYKTAILCLRMTKILADLFFVVRFQCVFYDYFFPWVQIMHNEHFDD